MKFTVERLSHMADADIVDSKLVVLRNADGKGGRWEKTELP